MHRLSLALVLLAAPLDAQPAGDARAGSAARDGARAPVPAEAYAVAVEYLLRRVTGAAEGAPVVLLPTSAGTDVAVRARRASGPAIAATAGTARAVARLLERPGARAVRTAPALASGGDALQLVLGELRYEPATAPRFARLKVAVVGVDATRATADFLLRHEPAGWRALNMRTTGLAQRAR